MTTIVAPPSNASKWQMGFNSAFKGLNKDKSSSAFSSGHVSNIHSQGAGFGAQTWFCSVGYEISTETFTVADNWLSWTVPATFLQGQQKLMTYSSYQA